MQRINVGFFAFVLLLLTPVMLSRPVAAAPLDNAEKWFNEVTTLEARFVQVASDGSYAEGTFYLKRPYRSRFDYDDPIALKLITTKLWLHVDEEDRRVVTSYPVSETPLSAILNDPVSLRGDGFTTQAKAVTVSPSLPSTAPMVRPQEDWCLNFQKSRWNYGAGL